MEETNIQDLNHDPLQGLKLQLQKQIHQDAFNLKALDRLQKECKFYKRLLLQVILTNGGKLFIDPSKYAEAMENHQKEVVAYNGYLIIDDI